MFQITGWERVAFHKTRSHMYYVMFKSHMLQLVLSQQQSKNQKILLKVLLEDQIIPGALLIAFSGKGTDPIFISVIYNS